MPGDAWRKTVPSGPLGKILSGDAGPNPYLVGDATTAAKTATPDAPFVPRGRSRGISPEVALCCGPARRAEGIVENSPSDRSVSWKPMKSIVAG